MSFGRDISSISTTTFRPIICAIFWPVYFAHIAPIFAFFTHQANHSTSSTLFNLYPEATKYLSKSINNERDAKLELQTNSTLYAVRPLTIT